MAIRLLGHAQRGENITGDLVYKPGPTPTIEGISTPIVPQFTGASAARSPGLPPLTPQDKAKFLRLFTTSGPVNGLLSGEKARDVFVKSKLPVDKLSQIWNLADSKNRGALDATDFTIALYLIQATMSGQLQSIPPVLSPSLYEQAGGKPALDGVAVHATGGSGTYSPSSLNTSFASRPMSTIEPHFTGQGSPLQPQMTGQMRSTSATLPRSALSNATYPLVQAQATGSAQSWDVTPTEKTSADRLFETLDQQKRGYIEGDVAVPFMLQSKLAEDVLAQVWDLADLNNDGRLTRDGFAVAMHLIQGKLNGREVPPSLPPSLIPPSMRSPSAPSAPPVQPSFTDSIRDLIWDDSPPASATIQSQPVIPAQNTGSLASRSTPAISSLPPAASSPFPISSPFVVPPAIHQDLLGDDDEPAATSPPLQDQSAEIGNVKNQLSSTSRSLDTAKAERENIERNLSDQAAQLSALQIQLSSAKAAYETESRLLSTLRERFASQTSEIQKAREELIHSESDLSAVRVEKTEVEGGFLRDKEEVRELQRKMTEVGMQAETLKAEVEKMKKDAKQQKGLLAIAKKQLMNRETERAKIEKELEEAKKEIAEITKEREDTEVELAKEVPLPLTNGHHSSASPDILAKAVAQPLPATPDIPTSPTGSVMSLGKSNNPFERVAMASGSGSRSQSPFLPFTNSTVLPTPSTAPADTNIEIPVGSTPNPFRLPQTLGTDESQSGADLSVLIAEPTYASPIDVMSPTDTDLFMTPPSTATFQTLSPTPQTSNSLAITENKETVSDIEMDKQVSAPVTQAASEVNETKGQATDLDHQLKELDAEESDTDSDSDSEDSVPLANVKDRLSKDFNNDDANGALGTSTTAPAISAFDDSFGISTSTEHSEHNSPLRSLTSTPVRNQSLTTGSQSAALDAFGAAFAPVSTTQGPFGAPPQPASVVDGDVPETPGVTDFDEAMGKISTSPSTSGGPSQFSQFSFDSAFDDNFDFAAASAATAPPHGANGITQPTVAPTVVQPQVNAFDNVFMPQPGISAASPVAPASALSQPQALSSGPPAQPAAEPSKTLSFDDAFGAVAGDGHLSSSPPRLNGVSNAISFDDAFGGRSSILALDSSFVSVGQESAGGPTASKGPTPFPRSTSPVSPAGRSPTMVARRSISPPGRQVTPPPRHSSPKPRPSTASSDKEKAPNARHSKLSLRLPFGRKKKATHDAPPVPPLASQQLVEEPTPPVEDDIDAVKQLCSMGFSRTQAVTALEMFDYDVQRALNSLLGEYPRTGM
ncbi:uncharacterized protein FIBRA_05992 [Fibroporia radiculosa]|uniref:Uncharacterized protein n=1 Tax=Fibroporia radiculosa TaxID=599839 RepID=J4GAG7_9APHY|nr:uncharacterized protein FIBRA_05992 [Fibroporia radiculosa]CCM03843.1 predicted protein [Fibroporia radiculosa]